MTDHLTFRGYVWRQYKKNIAPSTPLKKKVVPLINVTKCCYHLTVIVFFISKDTDSILTVEDLWKQIKRLDIQYLRNGSLLSSLMIRYIFVISKIKMWRINEIWMFKLNCCYICPFILSNGIYSHKLCIVTEISNDIYSHKLCIVTEKINTTCIYKL